ARVKAEDIGRPTAPGWLPIPKYARPDTGRQAEHQPLCTFPARSPRPTRPSRMMTEAIPLEDRYPREAGTVHLSGLHAPVRLPIDERRRDRPAGLRIGAYPGSPLG